MSIYSSGTSTIWAVYSRSVAARIAPHWLGTVVVFATLYRGIDWVLARPLAFFGRYLRPHAYGLSDQTFEKWLRDSILRLGISTLVAIVVAVVLYVCIRRFPRRWWLAATACLIPFVLFTMLIQPLWVAPLFNDFGPMKDPALEAKILALAERAGIEGGRVFEVNKSVDTRTANAYVTGFLASKRIVLWDTLLARSSQELKKKRMWAVEWAGIMSSHGFAMSALILEDPCHECAPMFREDFPPPMVDPPR